MRKCFLHIGTHKTGTSSIQSALYNSRAELARQGFLYPLTGIPPGIFGHHNISWAVTADPRYQRQNGTVDELLDEIGSSDQDVILSSEDFTCALRCLANLRSFIECLKQGGLRIIIVLYLRNQVDYFHSAYFEILKLGCGVPFEEFLSAMLQDQVVTWGDYAAGGALDFPDVLAQLADNDDVEITVRSYDRVRTSGIIPDFLSVIGLRSADLRIDAGSRENERMDVGDAFSIFYRNRAGRSPNAREAWLISALGRTLAEDEIHMSHRAKKMLLAKYERSNQIMKSRFGVPELADLATKMRDSAAERDHGPHLEQVFSVALPRFIEGTAHTLANETSTVSEDEIHGHDDPVALGGAPTAEVLRQLYALLLR